jgi:hypothetical protein
MESDKNNGEKLNLSSKEFQFSSTDKTIFLCFELIETKKSKVIVYKKSRKKQ